MFIELTQNASVHCPIVGHCITGGVVWEPDAPFPSYVLASSPDYLSHNAPSVMGLPWYTTQLRQKEIPIALWEVVFLQEAQRGSGGTQERMGDQSTSPTMQCIQRDEV